MASPLHSSPDVTPIQFKTTHRVRVSDLDPYDHMTTASDAGYFIDHRMEGLAEVIGWDLATVGALPFLMWTRRLEVEFILAARRDRAVFRARTARQERLSRRRQIRNFGLAHARPLKPPCFRAPGDQSHQTRS
jgi:acyl-CoA thioesterase FadM